MPQSVHHVWAKNGNICFKIPVFERNPSNNGNFPRKGPPENSLNLMDSTDVNTTKLKDGGNLVEFNGGAN